MHRTTPAFRAEICILKAEKESLIDSEMRKSRLGHKLHTVVGIPSDLIRNVRLMESDIARENERDGNSRPSDSDYLLSDNIPRPRRETLKVAPSALEERFCLIRREHEVEGI
ncbi:hypothetical protein AYJ54_43440 [Bradyrhizobium centrolobii]|uniref:Uncharacterized protein n=1 Tax=Bradyrhizobium centrolobii TaxID=1505087 RepID=A0A176Z2Q8_9BRAD|nr:hypothetical protein [Bradyrhizobium centrolobii]OAF13586.1 hypothetical protein AYJ54_43440 [Bradyrhizobium centrolobii]